MANKVRTYEGLVRRVLDDKKFRAKLKSDPEKALKSVMSKPPTNEQIAAVKNLKWDHLEKASKHFTRSNAAAGPIPDGT